MKLPRYTARTSTQLPRFQAPQLPSPALIRTRPQQYQPVQTPQQVYQQGQEGAELIRGITQGVAKVALTIDERVAQSDLDAMKAEYLRRSALAKHGATTQALYEERVDPQTGVVTYVKGWEDADQKYAGAMDAVAESLQENRHGTAVSEFGKWRTQVDAQNDIDIKRYIHDKKIDMIDANNRYAMSRADDPEEINRIADEWIKTGFHNPAVINQMRAKEIQRVSEDQFANEFLASYAAVEAGTLQGAELINHKKFLHFKNQQITDPKTKLANYKRIEELDNLNDAELEDTQNKKYISFSRSLAGLPLNERYAALDAAINHEGAEHIFGDNLLDMIRKRDALEGKGFQSNPDEVNRIRAMIAQYKYNDEGLSEVYRALDKAAEASLLNGNDYATLLNELDSIVMSEVNLYAKEWKYALLETFGISQYQFSLGRPEPGDNPEEAHKYFFARRAAMVLVDDIEQWIKDGNDPRAYDGQAKGLELYQQYLKEKSIRDGGNQKMVISGIEKTAENDVRAELMEELDDYNEWLLESANDSEFQSLSEADKLRRYKREVRGKIIMKGDRMMPWSKTNIDAYMLQEFPKQ